MRFNKKGKVAAALLTAMVAGVLFHVAFFTLLRLELPQFSYEVQGENHFSYLGNQEFSDIVLKERAVLFDSAPLFMPTKWNVASDYSKIVTLRQATEAFDSYPPIIRLDEVSVSASDLSEDLELSPKQFLPSDSLFYFGNLGKTELIDSLPEDKTGITAIIYSAIDSSFTREIELPDELSSIVPTGLWVPGAFLIQIRHQKNVGPVVLLKGTGFPTWDDQLSAYLSKIDFYRTLPDGYFKVFIAP